MVIRHNRSCPIILLLIAMLTGAAWGMEPLDGASGQEGHPLPFLVRGDFNTDFGWETPGLAFRQNTELRLYTKKDVLPSVFAELQLFVTYSNTDNQFTTSLRDSSLLDKSVSDLLATFDTSGTDSQDVNLGELFKLGGVALNSRYFPKVSLLLDRASIQVRSRFLDITLGKQVLAWGSGYFWNPTDAINLRNPLDPFEPRKGVGAVVVDVPAGEWFLLTLVMAPGKTLNESTEGLRAKFFTRYFDCAFSANLVGGSERYFLSSANIGLKPMAGFDFSTVLPADINAWMEASAASISPDTSNPFEVVQHVIGLQRVFFKNARVLVEWYRNDKGLAFPYTDAKLLSRNLALTTLGDMGGLGTSYFAGALIWTINDAWEMWGVGMRNNSDRSMAALPVVTWKPSQNFRIQFKFCMLKGDFRTTEFGSFKNSVITNAMYSF